MITLDSTPRLKEGGKYEMSFTGKSTDEEPIGTYKDKPIANGSSLFLMDTQSLKSYDEDTDTWIP